MKLVARTFALKVTSLILWAQPLIAEDSSGVVVNTTPDFQEIYVDSPSIAILPSGDLEAAHVWFGPRSTRDSTVIGRARFC